MTPLRGLWRCFSLTVFLLAVAGAAYPQLTLSPSTAGGPYTLPTGYTSKVYAGATLTTNGVGPTTWSVKGSLPPGLTFNPGQTSATITGTPTGVGGYVFSVSAFDPTFDQTVSQLYSITTVSLLRVTTPLALPSGTFGIVYSLNLTATGGTPPYTWTLPTSFAAAFGGLPPGMTLSSTGLLSGIPSQVGPFTFAIQVSDSATSNPQSVISTFSMTVNVYPTIQGGALPGGTLGVAYETTLTANGGSPPFLWVITQGLLPPGMVLFAGGLISGTPTQSGNFNFTVLAKDIWGASVSAEFTLQISSKLTITTLPPLNGAVAIPFKLQFTAGGSPPFSWRLTAGALPPGLAFNATGLMSGTPTTAGIFTFTVQVSDATNTVASNAFILTIAPQLVITTEFLPDAIVGTPYPLNQKITATGGTPPYNFSVTGFPAGLALNPSTGVITGTPTQGGRDGFTVQVTDSVGITATKALVINVIAIVFTTPSPLPGATLGVAYSQTIAVTGGAPPDAFTLDSGSLPGGLTLDATGTLSGTPTALGVFQFVVRVTDAKESTDTQTYQLTVAPPKLPAPTVTGISDTEPPAQQPTASVQLAAAYPLDLTATFTLTFASAVGGVDDPAIQFSNGKRTVQIAIPAGTTVSPNVTFSTGTVAGTITLTLSFQTTAGGQDVTPTPAPTRVIQIPAAAPVITAVTAHSNSSGLEVDVTGFSNTREMVSAAFQFQAAAGTNLQSSQVTIPADQLFASWFNAAGSQQYGSRFTLAQQFTISGNLSGISGVTVTLTNKQGTSNSATATVQ